MTSQPNTSATSASAAIERFYSKVNKEGPILSPSLGPCWVWTTTTYAGGYGMFYVEGKNRRAHRWIWEHTYGPLTSSSLQILHRCDNPSCVRLSHLFLGNNVQNMADMVAKRRQSRGEERPASLLSREEVEEIRKAYRAGSKWYGVKALCRKYGVGVDTIRGIVRKQTWR